MREQIEKILENNQQLSAEGFLRCYPIPTPPEELDWLAEQRELLLSESGVAQVERACRWLHKYTWRKTENRKFTSYAWKHAAQKEEGDYISNGALIVACIHLGVPVQIRYGHKSPWLGIGQKKSVDN